MFQILHPSSPLKRSKTQRLLGPTASWIAELRTALAVEPRRRLQLWAPRALTTKVYSSTMGNLSIESSSSPKHSDGTRGSERPSRSSVRAPRWKRTRCDPKSGAEKDLGGKGWVYQPPFRLVGVSDWMSSLLLTRWADGPEKGFPTNGLCGVIWKRNGCHGNKTG